ncbi:hypothetical protein BC835DRAFT_635479 [Cytidiella melzeri]|nr:hypothetical protein BC835DRAFT_635479 [Cytidiella melzeri]
MDFTSTHALRWGAIALFIFSCFQAMELNTKLRMLQSMQVVLHPNLIEHTYRNDDHHNALPVHLKETVLEVEWLDDEVYGLYADDDWKSLFPGDAGFVSLGTPPTQSEKQSFTSSWDQNVFGISFYHQLHCLDVFRYSYVAAKAHAISPHVNETGLDHHMNHCLNYMRQMVLCASDTTLLHTTELSPTNPRGRYGATVIGSLHRCRDWTQLRKFVEQHQVP